MVPAWLMQREWVDDAARRGPVTRTGPTSTGLQVYVALALRGTMDQGTGRYLSITPSYETIASDAGISRDTARRGVRELEAMGALVRTYRPGQSGERGADNDSNSYTLIFGEVVAPQQEGGVRTRTPGGCAGAPPGGAHAHPNPEPTYPQPNDPDAADPSDQLPAAPAAGDRLDGRTPTQEERGVSHVTPIDQAEAKARAGRILRPWWARRREAGALPAQGYAQVHGLLAGMLGTHGASRAVDGQLAAALELVMRDGGVFTAATLGAAWSEVQGGTGGWLRPGDSGYHGSTAAAG